MRADINQPVWAAACLAAMAMFAMVPARAGGGSMTFTAASNGSAQSPRGNGVYTILNSGANGDLPILNIPGTVQDVALMTFDLFQYAPTAIGRDLFCSRALDDSPAWHSGHRRTGRLRLETAPGVLSMSR